MGDSTTGILFLAFGGPESREAIGPFMTNLMGREPSPEVLKRAIAKYDLIGGFSPLPAITERQAKGVQARLAELGYDLPVTVGMRYWHPFIPDAAEQLIGEGVHRIVAISLSPHNSRVSFGAYESELEKVAGSHSDVSIELLPEWFDNQGFAKAIAEKVEAALPTFGGRQPFIVFSTHSLPVAYIESGDLYLEQVKATVENVMAQVDGNYEYRLAFQSRGGSPEPWLEPEVESVLEELDSAGKKDVLLVPVGFVSDHMETLYDIDIVHKKKADELGLNFKRTESLNDSPAFIEALANIIVDALK